MKAKKGCSVKGCPDPHLAGGLCNRHYIQMKRHGKITEDIRIDNIQDERWKQFKTTGSLRRTFFISNMGRIKSRTLSGREKLLKPSWDKASACLRISCGGKGRPKAVHHGVASAFLKKHQPNKRLVFLNGIKKDCCASNLMWQEDYFKKHVLPESIKQLKLEDNQNAKDILSFTQGNEKALNRIVLKYQKLIKTFILYKMKKYSNLQSTPDDLTQEVLIKAISAIQRGLLRTTEFLDAWFYTIAKNTLMNSVFKKQIKGLDIIPFNSKGDTFDDTIEFAEWKAHRKVLPNEAEDILLDMIDSKERGATYYNN